MINHPVDKIYFVPFLFSLILRIGFAYFHFTHYDDVGVLSNLIELNGNVFDCLSQFGWTYAPLQMILTSMMLKFNLNYSLTVFLGRVPSLIFGFLSIIVIIRLFIDIKRDTENKFHLPISSVPYILCLIIFSFSLENIIYSSQVEPYSIGVFFSSVICYLIYKLKEGFHSKKYWVLVTVIMILSCYSQYQLFLFVFCFYLTALVIYINIKDKRNLFIFISGVVVFIATLPLLLFVFKNGLLGRTVNWNAGINSQFLFVPSGGIVQVLKYFIVFFFHNIYIVFKIFFISNVSNSPIVLISTVIIILFFILGLVNVKKKFDTLFIYLIPVLISLLIMILSGKITLGPSRHLLVYYPILLILIYIGMLELICKNLFNRKFIFVYSLVITMLLSQSILIEIPKRSNYYNSKSFSQIINTYDPKIIYMYNGFDIDIFKIQTYTNYPLDNAIIKKDLMSIKDGDYVMFFGNVNPYVFEDNMSFDTYINACVRSKSYDNNSLYQIGNYEFITSFSNTIEQPTEVEYGSQYYENGKNVVHVYIYRINLN